MKKQRSPRDWREGCRLRALELHEQGWTGKAIGAALGVSQSAVSQRLKRGREGGPEALRAKPPPGRVPRLTAEQRAELPHLLACGAEAFGFLGEVWTSKRMARVIADEFGVHYHPDHVRRLLRTAGWSPQKPIRRATQRDEAAIERWATEQWPALQAKPAQRSAPLSGSTSPASIRCRRWCAPRHHAARRQSCTRCSPTTTSRSLAA
jgi:transposase